MIEQVLQKIGLTNGEIKVYLALLELGSTTTWQITKKSRVSGSKVYEVLDRLIKKGLASYIIKNNIRYFEAARPEMILEYLDQKSKIIESDKTEVQKIIPSLIMKQHQAVKAEAKIFLGFEGAKTAYEDAIQSLKKGDELYGWGLTDQPEEWNIYFNKREEVRSKKGIIHKTIFNEQFKTTTGYKGRKNLPNTYIRFFPKEMGMPTSMEVWKNKVAMFITTAENPITIVIESQAAADSFKKYFDLLWKQAKP